MDSEEHELSSAILKQIGTALKQIAIAFDQKNEQNMSKKNPFQLLVLDSPHDCE
jgi:hypothetical protein